MSQRIISLLPAATEIVCALWAVDDLAGRSHSCDYPPQVASLPVCSKAWREGERWVVELDEQTIIRLNPTAIITQKTCPVCAINEEQVRTFLKKQRMGAQVLGLQAQQLAGIWDDITAVAKLAAKINEGKELIGQLKNRVVDVLEKTCMMKKKPTVACIEWLEPLMFAGHWIPELVAMAAGEDVFGKPGEASGKLAFEQLKSANPDFVLLMPCGLSLSDTVTAAEGLKKIPGWRDLRAVRGSKVIALDGNQLYNRPGPRIVDSLELLLETLHPGIQTYPHVRHLAQRV